RPVTVVILIVRVNARRVLARAVHRVAVGVGRDVGREIAAQPEREVRRDVRVVTVDAGVDDADEHFLVAALVAVGAVGRGVDLLHVPLAVGQRLGLVPVLAPELVTRRRRRSDSTGLLDRVALLARRGTVVGNTADRRVVRDATDAGLRREIRDE